MNKKLKLIVAGTFLAIMAPLAVMNIMGKFEAWQSPEVVLENGTTKIVADNAMQQFFNFCPDAEQNWKLLKTASIGHKPNGFFGSSPFVSFDLQFSKDNKDTIKEFGDETLAFTLDAGDTPGLSLVKIVGNSAKFCGLNKVSARISEPKGKGTILIHGPVKL